MFAFNEDQKAAVLAAWPGLAPSQLAVLAKRVADNGGEDSAKVTSPEHCVYFLKWSVIGKDPSLIRPAPTPEQVVAYVTAQRKADGLKTEAVDALTIARTAKTMTDDERLAAIPAGAEVLKPKATAATKAANAPESLQDWLEVAAADNGHASASDYVRAVGPSAARGVAEHMQATAAKVKVDERPGHVKQSGGNAAVDALTSDPEFQKLPPAERMSRFRAAQNGK